MQHTLSGNLKDSVMPALKITLVLVGISAILGLLKRFLG